MFKPVSASILALAAMAVLAVSALAAGGTGPQHFSLSGQQCYDKGPYTFCSTSAGEETIVQTPSGNFSGEVNVRSSFAVTLQGSLLASGTDVFHEHVLYTNNMTVVQEGGIHEVSTQTSGGTTCTLTEDLHVTQLDAITGTGHIQYDNFSFVCV